MCVCVCVYATGFHTFDYARHFLSCCSRMLGLEHETSRGSITLDYYGRAVALKIMPTGKAQAQGLTVAPRLVHLNSERMHTDIWQRPVALKILPSGKAQA